MSNLYFTFSKIFPNLKYMAKKYRRVSSRRNIDFDSLTLKLTFILFGSFFVIVFSFALFALRTKASQICANSISCIKDLSGKKSASNEGVFMGTKVTAPELLD